MQENRRNWLKHKDKQQARGLKTAGNTITETAGCVRPERYKKWQKSMSARWWWWWWWGGGGGGGGGGEGLLINLANTIRRKNFPAFSDISQTITWTHIITFSHTLHYLLSINMFRSLPVTIITVSFTQNKINIQIIVQKCVIEPLYVTLELLQRCLWSQYITWPYR